MDLSTLNSRQRESVTSTEGRIRVIAGAGSGKTRALAFRYAYIVNELGIDPANILCLTFTNKAAQEMKSRISQLVPPGYTNDFVCTIHGFCVRFLREEIHRIGYPKNFQILDEEQGARQASPYREQHREERQDRTTAYRGTRRPQVRRKLRISVYHPVLPSNGKERTLAGNPVALQAEGQTLA